MNSNANDTDIDDQYRRGINRPNANRLTLSLGPLVAQRSLLFRIQSDLVHKSTYGELTPAEESAFFAMTPSARILSSAIVGKTPMSSASVYSQDSWRPPMTGILYTPFVTGPDDTRRRAMMFSPSLQWANLRSASRNTAPPSAHIQSALGQVAPYIGSPVPQCVPEDFTAISPVHSAAFNVAFVVNAGITIPSIEISRASTSISPVEARTTSVTSIDRPKEEDNPQREAVLAITTTQMQDIQSVSLDDAKKLKKKKPTEDASKRTPRHTTTFGRVMAHLSLQPTKRELDQRRKTSLPTMPVISKPLPLLPRIENSRPSSVISEASVSTTVSVPALASLLPQVSLVIPSLELPSARFSPIRTSFIANSFLSPNAALKPFSFLSEPMVASISEAGTRARAARASQGPGSLKRRTMPPAALNLPPMFTMAIQPALPAQIVPGHRRHKSSPAVLNFSWRNNDEVIPPVPKLPAMMGNSSLRVPT